MSFFPIKLGEFDSSASVFESLLNGLSVVLLSVLKHGLRSAVNDSFSFTKSKTSNVFNSLNNSNFLSTCVLQDNVVLSLSFFSWSGFATSRSSNSSYCSSWLDAIFILQDVLKFVYFENRKFGQVLSQFLQICHLISPYLLYVN